MTATARSIKGAPAWAATLALVTVLLTELAQGGCTATADPCSGQGSYTGSDTCTMLVDAVSTVCGPTQADCGQLLGVCADSNEVCRSAVDQTISAIYAAPDCSTAYSAVQANNFTCVH